MYIHMKVTPGAKKESFNMLDETHGVICVKEPAEQNRANKRLCEILAEHYRVSPKAVRIINGHHNRTKLISIG